MSGHAGKTTAVRILDAAEQIFAERGFDGASLGDVADRVGIRGPSLYNHFRNKRELYAAVLSRLLDPFFELLEELLERPPSDAREDAAIECMLRHHIAHPNLARLIQHAALAGGDQLELLVKRWYHPFFQRVPKLIPKAEDADQEATGRLTAMLIGFNNMILGYVTLAPLHEQLFGHDFLSEESVKDYIRFLRQTVV